MIPRAIAAALFALLLPACGHLQKFQQAGTYGEFQELYRSESLGGPDTNGNGVRDDIDAFIANKYHDPDQVAALTRSARSLQRSITFGSTSKKAAWSMADQFMLDGLCVNQVFSKSGANGSAADSEIESISTNTKERLVAYLRFNSLLIGFTYTLPDGDHCDR